MNYTKKWGILSLPLVLSALLCSACSSSAPADKNQAEEIGAETLQESQEEKAAAETQKITFATWQWGEAGYSDFYAEVAEQFAKENPGYEIEPIQIPNGDYWDKMFASVSSGTVPDIFMGKVVRIGNLVGLGALEPLDNYASPELLEDFKTVYQPIQSSNPIVTDGKTYALTTMYTSHQLFYNKQLLDEAGIEVPTTIDEFIEAVKQLTKAPEQYGYACMTTNESAFYDDLLIWSIGFDDNVVGGSININSPGVQEAFKKYKEIFDAGLVPQGVDKATYRTMFANGQIAFLIDGPWLVKTIESINPDIMEHIGTARVPFPYKNSSASDNLLYLSSSSKNKEIAWKYIELCASKDMQSRFAELTDCIPGRKDAVSSSFTAERPWYQAFVDGAPDAELIVAMDYLEIEGQIRKLIIDAGQAVLYENKDIPTVLQETQGKIDKLIEEY